MGEKKKKNHTKLELLIVHESNRSWSTSLKHKTEKLNISAIGIVATFQQLLLNIGP